MEKQIHLCQCARCQEPGEHPEKRLHHQMNLFLSRLDEQQRRWYVALESFRHGRGGVGLLAQITGVDEKTIWRGRREVESEFEGRPTEQVRQPGGGRPRVEKKHPKSPNT